jgi:hypothetical protein
MVPAPRRRVVIARALLALVFLLIATSCGGEKLPTVVQPAKTTDAPLELPVEASGLPEGVTLEIVGTTAGVESGENLDFVSPVYSLGPAGPLTDPVTVSIELDNALPASSTLFVVSRDSGSQPWSLQRGRLSPDYRHVEFQTSKLNEVGVLSLEVDGALSSLTSDISAGLVTGINRTVKKPSCDLQKPALESGYSVASSKSSSLFWCFGMENSKRVLRVTNRRLVPVQIVHPNVPVLADPAAVPVWASWVKTLGTAATFLPPGRSATYNADLEPKAALSVTSASGVATQSLRLLRAQVRALVIQLTRLGFGTANVTKTVAALLARPQCATTIGHGTDAMLTGCFSRAKLLQTFGPRAQLLVPLVAAPAYAASLRPQATTLTAAQPAETQRIVVKRAAPDFSALVGFWSGASRLMTVNGEGLVSEQLDSDGKLVIRLTYQLQDPVTTPAKSTARATLKSVKIGQRKLLNGRVPHVGDTGTLTRRYGLMTPPFLKTTYCSESASKRKVCQ